MLIAQGQDLEVPGTKEAAVVGLIHSSSRAPTQTGGRLPRRWLRSDRSGSSSDSDAGGRGGGARAAPSADPRGGAAPGRGA